MAHFSTRIIVVIGSNPTDETMITVGMSTQVLMNTKGLVLSDVVNLTHDNLMKKATFCY